MADPLLDESITSGQSGHLGDSMFLAIMHNRWRDILPATLAPLASPTFTGTATAPAVKASGITGMTGAARIVGRKNGPPVAGTYEFGDVVVQAAQENFTIEGFWICTVSGTPGTWVYVPQVQYVDQVGVNANLYTDQQLGDVPQVVSSDPSKVSVAIAGDPPLMTFTVTNTERKGTVSAVQFGSGITYQSSIGEFVLASTVSGAVTVLLPNSPQAGEWVIVKRTGGGTDVLVQSQGTDLINGVTGAPVDALVKAIGVAVRFVFRAGSPGGWWTLCGVDAGNVVVS